MVSWGLSSAFSNVILGMLFLPLGNKCSFLFDLEDLISTMIYVIRYVVSVFSKILKSCGSFSKPSKATLSPTFWTSRKNRKSMIDDSLDNNTNHYITSDKRGLTMGSAATLRACSSAAIAFQTQLLSTNLCSFSWRVRIWRCLQGCGSVVIF